MGMLNVALASSPGESEKPGEVVVHHLTDRVVDWGFIGWINERFFSTKLFGIFDMRITRWVIMIWIATILCIVVFVPIAVRIRRAAMKGEVISSRWLTLWEVFIEYIQKEVVEPNFGARTPKVTPYFLTIFFFILFCNFIGLIPGMSSATGNLAVTGALALLTLLEMFIIGFIKHGPLWIITGIVPHGLPAPIYIIMWPIELIGLFMKPIVLMIRLFANMLAGHIVIIVFVMLVIMFQSYLVAIGAIPGVIFVDALELLVAFIQAYVFTMLSAIFVSSCMEGH
ncbi:MAG TPA: F0F1 ATP synthase subunit A [Spirochaetota bacterium]